MRIAGCLLAFILCTGAPAEAGIRATYTVAGEPDPVVVEIDDSGVTRLGTADESMYFLVIGRSAYVVGRNVDDPNDDRSFAVLGDDLVAAIRRTGTRIPIEDPALATGAPLPPTLGLTDLGSATVAGVSGHRFRINGANFGGAPAILAVADDPALQRGGESMGIAIKAIMLPMLSLTEGNGPKLTGWIQQMLPYLDRGLPLAFGDEFVLRELKRDVVIPPGRTKLPSVMVKGAELDRLIADRFKED